MKVIRCGSLHYYDADKYAACPHCARETMVGKNAEQSMLTSSGPVPQQPSASTLWKQNPDNKTVILLPPQESSPEPLTPKKATEAISDIALPIHSSDKKAHEQVTPSVAKQVQEEPALEAQLNDVMSASPIYAEDTKTVAFYSTSETEPVVGWLVCVKGNYLGQSFTMKTGRNNIGRSMNMDIPLAQEPSVSRNTHAAIIYEPNNRVFYLQAGESNGLTYLNHELVIAHAIIKAYDYIQLGEGGFIFIPCCGEQFAWSDYI